MKNSWKGVTRWHCWRSHIVSSESSLERQEKVKSRVDGSKSVMTDGDCENVNIRTTATEVATDPLYERNVKKVPTNARNNRCQRTRIERHICTS